MGTDRIEPLDRLLPALIDRLPRLLADVGQRLRDDWPDYALFLREEHEEVATAAEAFLRSLVEIADRDLRELSRETMPPSDAQVALFSEIGRIQWREGRDVSTLLSAYQLGARVAWHHVSDIALTIGVAPNALAALAEAVFVFVDQLCSASAHGFVLEQSEAGATRERLREELVDLLLATRADRPAITAAAARAGWSLPREMVVILVDSDNPLGPATLSRLDPAALLIRRRGVPGAILPDPSRPGRRSRLAAALRGAGAVVGQPVAVEGFAASVRIAEIAARLRQTGVLAHDPFFVDEHLDEIIVHRDARLLEALRQRCLSPLASLTTPARERLCDTLASWLRHLGDRRAVAAELFIHPQTVRYRMAQLHDLFGPALDDPAARTQLTLALVWGRVHGRDPEQDHDRGQRRGRGHGRAGSAPAGDE